MLLPLKKIVVAADLAPNKIGSIECNIFECGRLLTAQGVQVKYAFAGEPSDAVLAHFQLNRADIIAPLGSPSQPANTQRWLSALAVEKPDLVWLHFIPIIGGLLGRVRRKLPQVKICLTDHDSRGMLKRGFAKWLYCRARAAWCNRHVDRVFAVSSFIGRRLLAVDHLPASKICVIPNAIDLDRFSRLSETHDDAYLVAVCHMRPFKGVPVLLEALLHSKKRGHDYSCKLIGDGPQLNEYRAFAKQHDLHRVEFLGLRDDVPQLLADAMLMIVPSVWPEAFGLAAAEGSAAGLPVIASNIGGLPEVIAERASGMLVPPNDSEALSMAIETLAHDRPLRLQMGRAGRDRVEQLFDLKMQSGKIVDELLATINLNPASRESRSSIDTTESMSHRRPAVSSSVHTS